MQEPEQKRRFIAGLKTDIRRHVELQNPETLDDCFRIAQRVDSINFASRNRQQHDPFRSYNSPGATPMELGYLDTDQDPDGGAAQPPSSDIIAAMLVLLFCVLLVLQHVPHLQAVATALWLAWLVLRRPGCVPMSAAAAAVLICCRCAGFLAVLLAAAAAVLIRCRFALSLAILLVWP